MRKIIVIGPPGSGKSFFSRKLRDALHINLYCLDCIYWKENWEHLSKDEFKEELDKIISLDSFIIDGLYANRLESRFVSCDTVFFLDLPIEICVESVNQRVGKKREDLPDFLEEKHDPEFIEYIKNFPNDGRIRVLELIEKYKDEKDIIVFKSRDEVNEYIRKLERK